jgi:hypothetical protein
MRNFLTIILMTIGTTPALAQMGNPARFAPETRMQEPGVPVADQTNNQVRLFALVEFRRHRRTDIGSAGQNESPGKDKESNWLPAPKGDMRFYWPKDAALDGKWKHPPMTRAA